MSFGEYYGKGSTITKGLYHFNGDLLDSSGNGYNGTGINITYKPCKVSTSGAYFNGSSSYITLSNSSVISGNSARTFSAWLNYTFRDNNTYFPSIIGGGSNAYGQDFHFMLWDDYSNNNDLRIGVRRYYDDQRSVSIKNLITDGRCHQVAVVYDGTSTGGSTDYNAGIRYYVDGSQIKRDVTTGWNTNVTFNTAQNNATIGGVGAGANLYLGTIDEVIKENINWSNEEMKKYYTYSRGLYGIL